MSYRFDPELADFAAQLPDTRFDDPVAARAGLVEMSAAMNAAVDTQGLDIRDLTLPDDTAHPALPLRLYRPAKASAGTTPGAALLYIHGGGFVVGSLETEHGSCVQIARELGILVVSVDYRLAPEHPYPAGLEDCYRALDWLHAEAGALGVDTTRIGVFGQSAGGGLAAALCLLARDRQGPPICFQFLGMPELDDRLHTPSMCAFTDTPLWNRPNAELSWAYYLGEAWQPGADSVPMYAAPARASADQLRGLPPAYVTAMEFDPLRDEDIRYALALLEAGVSVELHTFPGTFHGSSLVTTAAVSRRQDTEMLDALRRGLGCA